MVSDYVKPDIIFYQEPYEGNIDSNKEYKRNFRALFCYCNYAFHTIDERWSINQPFLNFVWQIYYENELAKYNCSKIMTCIATGLPIMDLFIAPRGNFDNPWNSNDGRKLIIWAPHHSIRNEKWVCTSTF